jgi:hypothetical protein
MNSLHKNAISLRPTLLPVITIIVLVGLKCLATPLYGTSLGRFPAMMIEAMASRTILFDWAPAGYYEELFGAGRNDRQQLLYGSTTFIPDAYRLRRLRPNMANVTDWIATDTPTNRFGYIGPEWSFAEQPDTRRIAILGDSVTAGFGVNMNQSFVSLLANRLDETAASQGSAQRFEFLNFAVPAYHLTQMMDVATHDVPQFHPDVYMVPLTALSVYRSWDSHLIYLVQSGVDVKYDFLREVIARAHARQSDDQATLTAKFAPYRMSVIRQALSIMKANAEQNHAQFFVVLIPAVDDGDLPSQRFEGIPDLLSSMNITYIDLSHTFAPLLDRQSIRLSRADVHPNPLGHSMICESLYEELRADPEAWSKLVGPAFGADQQSGFSK